MDVLSPQRLATRPAQATDAPHIARLLGELGYPTAEADVPGRLAAMTRADHAVLLAVDDDAVLGLVGLHRYPVIHRAKPVAYITALVTAPEARRRGVGRALLEAAERWARDAGCERISVTSHENRSAAHAFYASSGFPYTGRRFSRSLP